VRDIAAAGCMHAVCMGVSLQVHHVSQQSILPTSELHVALLHTLAVWLPRKTLHRHT
jgi:hypothetical protein